MNELLGRRLHDNESRVIPDIRLLGAKQDPPARSKRKVGNQLRCVLHDVMHMQRLEKVGILRVIAAPDIPAACPMFRRVPKRVERQLRECGKCHSQTIVLSGRLEERTELLACIRLRQLLHAA